MKKEQNHKQDTLDETEIQSPIQPEKNNLLRQRQRQDARKQDESIAKRHATRQTFESFAPFPDIFSLNENPIINADPLSKITSDINSLEELIIKYKNNLVFVDIFSKEKKKLSKILDLSYAERNKAYYEYFINSLDLINDTDGIYPKIKFIEIGQYFDFLQIDKIQERLRFIRKGNKQKSEVETEREDEKKEQTCQGGKRQNHKQDTLDETEIQSQIQPEKNDLLRQRQREDAREQDESIAKRHATRQTFESSDALRDIFVSIGREMKWCNLILPKDTSQDLSDFYKQSIDKTPQELQAMKDVSFNMVKADIKRLDELIAKYKNNPSDVDFFSKERNKLSNTLDYDYHERRKTYYEYFINLLMHAPDKNYDYIEGKLNEFTEIFDSTQIENIAERLRLKREAEKQKLKLEAEREKERMEQARLEQIRQEHKRKMEPFYDELELVYGADIEECKKARNILLQRYHPDKNAEKVGFATRKTIRIKEAYDAIMEWWCISTKK